MINISNQLPITKIQHSHTTEFSYRMSSHECPVSITNKEFNIITNSIINNNYQYGYEVATAFGISALAAGLGFKETKGMLLSIDSYIEESVNGSHLYDINHKVNVNKQPDGLMIAQQICNNVPVTLRIGKSPEDTLRLIHDHFGPTVLLDYVFIDAFHTDDALWQDFNVIKDILNPNKSSVFIHDGHLFNDKFIKTLHPVYTRHATRYNLVEMQFGT